MRAVCARVRAASPSTRPHPTWRKANVGIDVVRRHEAGAAATAGRSRRRRKCGRVRSMFWRGHTAAVAALVVAALVWTRVLAGVGNAARACDRTVEHTAPDGHRL